MVKEDSITLGLAELTGKLCCIPDHILCLQATPKGLVNQYSISL